MQLQRLRLSLRDLSYLGKDLSLSAQSAAPSTKLMNEVKSTTVSFASHATQGTLTRDMHHIKIVEQEIVGNGHAAMPTLAQKLELATLPLF